ncbi:heterodisulfide reductase-related iron-sulfur binding cluster [Pendulispora albinea]|uniref:Cysteine-rich domain-containing protein n=1 Tax=Pendulispora albinea TaxID=2741071 RepID=A0ABZ2LJ16_9BACT
MSKIDPRPTEKPEFNPNAERYWDARDLEGELRRVIEICHNCRMCVNYCGSFPDMFARVDRDIDAGATGSERLGIEDFTSITDHCWQCKICYIKCPYTPDEGHEWLVDLPRLLMREKAQRSRRNGISLQETALGEPGILGSLASGVTAPLVNFVNANRLVRKTIEKVAGISSEFPIPSYAAQPFARWLANHEPLAGAGSAGKVALFSTCLGDYYFPSVPANAVRALEKNGYAVFRPEQQCCGMPNLDGGDLEGAKAKARFNVASLHAALEQGYALVGAQPTCTMTVKGEYPELLGTREAREVADNVYDLMGFFDKLRKEKKLNREFTKPLGKIAYHAPCHLRAQKIGYPAVRVLNLVQDTEVELVEQCSAIDGTWGMKAENYEEGRKYAERLVRGIEAAEAELVVSDCQLAARRIQKENGVQAIHPVEALASAYGVAISRASETPR